MSDFTPTDEIQNIRDKYKFLSEGSYSKEVVSNIIDPSAILIAHRESVLKMLEGSGEDRSLYLFQVTVIPVDDIITVLVYCYRNAAKNEDGTIRRILYDPR